MNKILAAAAVSTVGIVPAQAETIEIKAFLPSKDFALSRQFYIDLGFTVAWGEEGVAYLHAGKSSFLLTHYYQKEFAENCMMHLLVKDVEAMQALVPPPSYPSIRRDAALIVGTDVRHERVVAVARAAAPAELEKIELFDVYQGKNLGAGRKSMAYAFTYRSKTGTLTDEAANGFQAKVNAALKAQLPAEIRES